MRKLKIKRAQISIAYLGFFILLSFIFMGLTYGLSTSIKQRNAEELGKQIIDNILTRVQKSLVDIKTISENTEEEVVVVKLELPKRIGEDEYVVYSTDNKYLVLRTLGANSILKRKKVYWWDVNITGIFHSNSNYLMLEYNKSKGKIVIS